jgi:hypothetical protein
MTIRTFGALACGAALVLAMQTDLAQAQKTTTQATTINGSKSNNYKQGQPGGSGPAQATTIKGSKSNGQSFKPGQPGGSGPATR